MITLYVWKKELCRCLWSHGKRPYGNQFASKQTRKVLLGFQNIKISFVYTPDNFVQFDIGSNCSRFEFGYASNQLCGYSRDRLLYSNCYIIPWWAFGFVVKILLTRMSSLGSARSGKPILWSTRKDPMYGMRAPMSVISFHGLPLHWRSRCQPKRHRNPYPLLHIDLR